MRVQSIARWGLVGSLALLACGGEPTEPAFGDWVDQLVFVSERDGNGEIYLVNADGSGLTNLSKDPGEEAAPILWSPDGTKLAFVSRRDGDREIYIMNADGSGVIRTNATVVSASQSLPAWRPHS